MKHSIGEPDETVGRDDEAPADDVRCMTLAQFCKLGVRSIVYLRPDVLNGQLAYVIHAADGVPMAALADIDAAVALASEHGMVFVAVH
jgi:hypothetical protein